jgi:hypothetical protein
MSKWLYFLLWVGRCGGEATYWYTFLLTVEGDSQSLVSSPLSLHLRGKEVFFLIIFSFGNGRGIDLAIAIFNFSWPADTDVLTAEASELELDLEVELWEVELELAL